MPLLSASVLIGPASLPEQAGRGSGAGEAPSPEPFPSRALPEQGPERPGFYSPRGDGRLRRDICRILSSGGSRMELALILVYSILPWLLFVGLPLWLVSRRIRKKIGQSEARLRALEGRASEWNRVVRALDQLEARLRVPATEEAKKATPVAEPPQPVGVPPLPEAAAPEAVPSAIPEPGAPPEVEPAAAEESAPPPEVTPAPPPTAVPPPGYAAYRVHHPEEDAVAAAPGVPQGAPAEEPTWPSPQPPPQAPALSERWRPLERLFIEKWTGMLGAVILVAGVAFVGISMALRLSPFVRTLLIIAGSAALVAVAYSLRKKPAWVPLSLWLRSSGAATFLFACFGASAIPGLRWIEGMWPALGFLLLGIAANLYLAFAGGVQSFASLHVVLSLVPLMIIPQATVPLLLATLVTLFGILLSFRARWDAHLLITLLAYGVYHARWYVGMGIADESAGMRLVGLGCAVVAGAAAALVHYRKDYRSQALERIPFLTHLTNWGLLALAGLVYSIGTPLRGVALLAASVVVLFLARRGRSLGVRWLYLTDTLIAQGLAVAGILSFQPFVFDRLLVLAFLVVETALFARIVADEAEVILKRVGLFLLHASAAVLGFAGLTAAETTEPGLGAQHALIILAAALAGVVAHLYFQRTRGEAFDAITVYDVTVKSAAPPSLLGILTGFLVLSALANLRHGTWMATAALVAIAPMILLARRYASKGLAIGAWIALLPAHLYGWAELASDPSMATAGQLARLVPPLLLSALAIRFVPAVSLQAGLRRIAIYLAGIQVGLGVYFLCRPVSPLIPGVVWLALSLIALELASRLREGNAASVLHVGYLYILGFFAQYAVVYIQAEAYLGPLPARLLVEAFGLAVLAYWWVYRPGETMAGLKSWTRIHPLYLEALLLFLAAAVAVEAATQWRPVAWCVLALACLAGVLSARLAPRFRFYSLLFFWLSTLDLVIVTSGFATPSPLWYEHPGFTGGLAILLMIAYLIRSHGRLLLREVSFPLGLGGLSAWSCRIDARPALWVYYPFFICVALFLYWRFDQSMLTLLWAAEAFAVFVLSAVLREEQFRYMALAALGACLIRLIGYDLAQSDTLTRGVVFLGVGALMLSMNTVYNRFKERFK